MVNKKFWGTLIRKNFQFYENRRKIDFSKKVPKWLFFQVKSFFLEKHQKLHILAKSDVSRLSFKKNIPKSIFGKIFFLAKILHISKMTILTDFCMISKMGKLKSYVKIDVIFVFSVLKLSILAHQGIILTYVAEIMLILFKNTEIYIKNLFFKYFWPNTRYKIFKNNTNRLNLSRAFDWCMNWQYWTKYIFFTFLW